MISGEPQRKAAYPINKLFTQRWSRRAMSGEAVTREELMTLFEAARWAPSSFNAQPWRFIYALKGTAAWKHLFDLLVPANQQWVAQAGALIVIVSDKESNTHSLDTGAAWENLALQGADMGLVVHGMAGFDYDKAAQDLKIPATYKVEAMVAVGRPGKPETLPEDLRKRELPSDRKPVSEVAFEGTFGCAQAGPK